MAKDDKFWLSYHRLHEIASEAIEDEAYGSLLRDD